VRGRALKRRTDESWMMSAALRERLRPVLEEAGLDPSGDIVVSESPDENGFHLRQQPSPGAGGA
jgi:hypothetical protein